MKKINIAKFFRYSMSALMFPQIIMLTLNYILFLPFQFRLESYDFILLFMPLLFYFLLSLAFILRYIKKIKYIKKDYKMFFILQMIVFIKYCEFLITLFRK